MISREVLGAFTSNVYVTVSKLYSGTCSGLFAYLCHLALYAPSECTPKGARTLFVFKGEILWLNFNCTL